MMDFPSFETFLLVDEGKAGATANSLISWLKYAERHGFNPDRFIEKPDWALEEGRAWLAHLRQKGVSPGCYNNHTKVLNALARYSDHKDMRFKGLRTAPSTPKWLSENEIRRLFMFDSGHREMKYRAHALLHFALATGMRRSEIAALNEKDLDRDNCMVDVRKPAKRGLERKIPVPKALWDPTGPFGRWLKLRPRVPGDKGAIWTTSWGGDVHRVRGEVLAGLLWKMGVDTGVKVSFVRTRHTAATRLQQAGAQVQDIQYYLGHAKLTSTEIYTGVTQADVVNRYRGLSLAPIYPKHRHAKRGGVEAP